MSVLISIYIYIILVGPMHFALPVINSNFVHFVSYLIFGVMMFKTLNFSSIVSKYLSKLHFKMWILEYGFFCAHLKGGTEVSWNLQASSYHCLGSTLISRSGHVRLHYYYNNYTITAILPVRHSCDYASSILLFYERLKYS